MAVILGLLSLSGCSKDPHVSTETFETESSTKTPPVTLDNLVAIEKKLAPQQPVSGEIHPEGIRLVDRAADLGVSFTYSNGARGQLLMVESIGGGAGWLDIDQDELPDVYFAQGGIPDTPDADSRPVDTLFRQLCDGTFSDVTNASGTGDKNYSQGVAVGDFDDDGFDDILVTNVGQNTLYRNCGDGTFANSSDALPAIDSRWSSSAAWADLDQDGYLDLYVCNYLQYDPLHPLECLKDGHPALCHPRQIEAWPDECYRNVGNGTFERVTDAWGLSGPGNKALGVAIADFTNDGRPDIYVANDTTANFLFVRQPDGRFQDEALRRGVALNQAGDAQASMGVAVADYDKNGLPDILLSHFTGESNTLYQNQGDFGMQDVSSTSGIRKHSFPKLGFGIVMQDFNADGFQECLIANGHIDERNADFDGYEQHPQLLSFDGSQWQDVSEGASPYFARKLVGRGIATADADGDGDLDAIVVHQNQPAAFLINESEQGHWLQLRFTGVTSNRRGVGCRVVVQGKDGKSVAQLVAGTSFASAHQPVLVFGMGNDNSPVEIEVQWPSGIVQSLRNVTVDQTLRIREPRQ